MLVRAIALSIALLVGIGTVIPYMTDSTEAGPRKKKKKKQWKVKKYSKKWWQLYRAQERRKKAIAARKRTLRAKQILATRQKKAKEVNTQTVATSPVQKETTRTRVATKNNSKSVILPSGGKAPETFKQSQVTNSELQFNVSDNSGGQLGTASLSVVGPAMGQDSNNVRSKMIGGVPTTSLRRNVIDKMMREDGWVVNDYQKNINGKSVYVVEAQTSVRGSVQSRLFYFTEVDGRIYSLSTTSPNGSQERIAQESEKVIQSLQRGNRPTQAGLK